MKAYITTYTEVNLNNAEKISRFYTNPMTRTYQYEYALFEAISSLFRKTVCNSMCLESLKLYFNELPEKEEKKPMTESENTVPGENEVPKKTQESVVEEINALVERDVLGHVTFPMMKECMAEARVIRKDDGSHSFVFSDGMYLFTVSLGRVKKGHPRRIHVKDYSDIHATKMVA